jgi:signal peptidase II
VTPTLKQLVWRVLVPVLALDQLLKLWVKLTFTVGERMAFVPGLLELQFIENEGMAFGWALPGVAGKLLLTSFRLVAAVAIGIYIGRRVREEAPNGVLYSLTFVWAGALGNIVDSAIYGRLFSRSGWGTLAEWLPSDGGYAPWFQGYVVDMFHFVVTWPTWFPVEAWAGREVFPPIWNLADAAISVSVIWMLLHQRAYFPSVR